MDALSIATAELQQRALVSGRRGGSRRTTALGPLVRAVGAVGVPVAGPQAWNTNAVIALEIRGAAGNRWAGGFITAVVTVRLFITHEGGGYTVAIPAAEF